MPLDPSRQPELFDTAWEGRERFRALAAFTASREAARAGRCVIAVAHFADGVRFEGRQEMAAARGNLQRKHVPPSTAYENALDALLAGCVRDTR